MKRGDSVLVRLRTMGRPPLHRVASDFRTEPATIVKLNGSQVLIRTERGRRWVARGNVAPAMALGSPETALEGVNELADLCGGLGE
jgi:hypothetical protein